MKKVKKTLTSVVLVAQVLSITAGAATVDSVKTTAGYVTVKGTSSDDFVSYKVHKKGAAGNLISDICEMGEVETNNGEYLIEFKMPKYVRGQETDGEYVVKVTGENTDSGEFLVVAYSSQRGFVEKINGSNIATGSDLVGLFGANADGGYTNLIVMNSLGADVDYYVALDGVEKEEVANVFFAEKGNASATIENFSRLFSNAIKVQYINKNKASGEWFDQVGLAFEDESFGEVTDEALKTWILGAVNCVITETTKFNTYAEVEKKYREANVLYILNKEKHTAYEEKIALYDDVIDIVDTDYYKDYLGMLPKYKNQVDAEVKNTISNAPAINAAAFRSVYEEAITKVKAQIAIDSRPAGGGGSPGGGSSGGGSSSGGKVSPGVSMIQAESSNPTKGFNDLASFDWARKAINELAKNGIVAGYDDNTFKPQKNITREEFIKMVVAAKGMSLDTDACTLADVDQSKWYAPYVNAAYQSGIIKGVSESEFGIGKEITREDMAVIIARIMNYENADDLQNVFADEDMISPYAKDAVYSLYKAGKIAGIGDNMFGPKQIVNRAQAGKIIYDTLFSGM